MKAEINYGNCPEVKSVFTIGKNNVADYAFPNSTLKPLQCQIEFNAIWGWQISSNKSPESPVSPTFVHLPNLAQSLQANPSYIIQLFNGMQLQCGDYEFLITARNTNPDLPPTTLFEDDKTRYFEETEEEVRIQMTGMS